jgi:flagellar hook-associated protein 2
MAFQVGGLISGLDTNTLITQLMTLERQPLVQMEAQKHVVELRKDLWNEINTSLLSLKTKNDDLLKVNAIQQKTAVSSDTKILTATAATAAVSGIYSIDITQLAKSHRVQGDKNATTTGGTFTIGDGTYSASINVASGESLQSIADKINAAKDTADPTKDVSVKATVVDSTLVLEHELTGAANNITASDTTGTALQELGVLLSTPNNFKTVLQTAQDASFTVNGVSVTRSSNTNLTDVVSGVTLNLYAATAGTPVSLEVKTDTDGIVSKIRAFVDQYNTVMDLINTRLSEDKVKDATTDAGMRKGLLRGDSVLIGIKNDLRQIASDPIAVAGGAYDRLSDIGITTDSTDFGKSGKLVIDETKLRDALNTDPASVQKLFFNDSDADGIVDAGETGVSAKVFSKLNSLTDTSTATYGTTVAKKGIIAERLDSFGRLITSYDSRMADFEQRMTIREQGLRQKFLMMEQSLLMLQGQGDQLSQRLSQVQSNL